MIWYVHSGSGSWFLPIPDPGVKKDPDPGVKKAPDLGSGNTGFLKCKEPPPLDLELFQGLASISDKVSCKKSFWMKRHQMINKWNFHLLFCHWHTLWSRWHQWSRLLEGRQPQPEPCTIKRECHRTEFNWKLLTNLSIYNFHQSRVLGPHWLH